MADVSKFIDRAEQEGRRRNYDSAIALYAEILQIDPDSGPARSGIRLMALKKHEKRYPSSIQRGIGNLPANLLLPLARMFRAQGWVASLCESALKRDPRNPKMNNLLGHALLAQGYRNGAEAAFTVVAEFDPRNVEALKTLGQLLYEKKDIEGALACYEKVLKVAPRDQDAAKMRKNLAAEAAIKTGGFESARSSRDLAKSQRQIKNAERAQKIVRSTEDIEEAIADLEEAIEESPEDLKLHLKLGALFSQKRDHDHAVDSYSVAKRISPEDPEVLERLGDARIHRLEARLQEAQKGIEAGEDGAEDRVRRLKRDLRDLQIEEARRRVTIHPTDMALRFRLGRYLIADDQIQEAIEQFQKSVKDPRHRLVSLHLLGRAFAAQGVYDLAIKQLSEAESSLAGMTDQRKDILYDLAKVHEKNGSADEALNIYKQIYEADISYRDVGQRIQSLKN